ncbi:MAG: heme-binding protein [Clostridia bacterium]|nr:heme-binding protein [Clostridia bacterium]
MNDQVIKETVDRIVDEFIHPTEDMTLTAAQRLADRVKKKAKEMGVNAVVAITNKAARPVLVECMDDSYFASYDIALNKAYTVVSLKMTTSQLSELAQPGRSLYGIQFTNGGKIVIFGGGEPLRNRDGKIIGGLGVSGGSEEQDTALAKYGREIFEKGCNHNGY